MKKTKLILVILVSFYISSFLKDHIFFVGTPKLKPFITERFLKYLSSLGEKKEKNIVLEQKETIAQNDKESFYPISKGIYAKEVKGGKVILMKENEIDWKIYEYEINGKKISIKVPEGEDLPSREVVEEVFSR